MGRPLKVVEPNGFYHAVSRGNNRQDIFDDELRALYLWELTQVARRFDWLVYAWALMSNHVHLVLQIGERGISDGMHQLNTWFAKASNVRFGRVNHCFGQRYWSTVLETERHLLESIRYTLWNPARAGVGEHPADSSWTSYRGSVGLEFAPEPLESGRLLVLFGSKPDTAQEAFARFVGAGARRCLEPWRNGVGIVR